MPEVSHHPISACAAPRRLCDLDPSRSSRSTKAPFSYEGCLRAPSALFLHMTVTLMLIVLSCCRLSALSVLSRSSISCTFATSCLPCLPYRSFHTPGQQLSPSKYPEASLHHPCVAKRCSQWLAVEGACSSTRPLPTSNEHSYHALWCPSISSSLETYFFTCTLCPSTCANWNVFLRHSDKPSEVEGFPQRSWSIEVYVVNDKGEQIPANLFDKVTYHLHPSFGSRAVQSRFFLAL